MSAGQSGPGRRPFVRIGEEGRRAALIDATLDLIAEGGPHGVCRSGGVG